MRGRSLLVGLLLLMCLGSTLGTYVRFFHAIAEAREVDIYANGKAIIKGMVYSKLTKYISVSPDREGLLKIEFHAGGNTDVLFYSKASVPGDGHYTVVACGLLTKTKIYPFQALFFQDLHQSLAARAALRTIHASAGSINMNVLVDGEVAYTNIAYGTTSQPEFGYLKAGNRSIAIRATGEGGPIVVGPLDVALAGRSVTTIIILGVAGNERTPLTAIVEVDYSTDSPLPPVKPKIKAKDGTLGGLVPLAGMLEI